MSTPRSSTTTIIAAMRALARDIDSPDGVANAAILEAAERMEEMLHNELEYMMPKLVQEALEKVRP